MVSPGLGCHPVLAGARTSSAPSSRAVAAVTSATAWSKAAALCAAGARKPLTFRTYWSAAARMSASVTTSAYGGRRVLMERHMPAAYAAGPRRRILRSAGDVAGGEMLKVGVLGARGRMGR